MRPHCRVDGIRARRVPRVVAVLGEHALWASAMDPAADKHRDAHVLPAAVELLHLQQAGPQVLPLDAVPPRGRGSARPGDDRSRDSPSWRRGQLRRQHAPVLLPVQRGQGRPDARRVAGVALAWARACCAFTPRLRGRRGPPGRPPSEWRRAARPAWHTRPSARRERRV